MYRLCLQETQAIACATLFSPVIRQEAVQAMSTRISTAFAVQSANLAQSSLQDGQRMGGLAVVMLFAWLSSFVCVIGP